MAKKNKPEEHREKERKREQKQAVGERAIPRRVPREGGERILLKYKVKWQRIYAGIKVQLFGTICIT